VATKCELSDKERWEQAKRSVESLGALLMEYDDRIVKRCWQKVSNYADAQDLKQVVFMKAFRKAKKTTIKTSIQAFLYRIAYTTCTDELRKRYRRRSVMDNFEKDGSLPCTASSYGEDPSQQIDYEILRRCLDEIDPVKREVFELRALCGLKWREIGEVVGKSPQTAYDWYNQARRLLQDRLPKGEWTDD